jgi:hypothetical protein
MFFPKNSRQPQELTTNWPAADSGESGVGRSNFKFGVLSFPDASDDSPAKFEISAWFKGNEFEVAGFSQRRPIGDVKNVCFRETVSGSQT